MFRERLANAHHIGGSTRLMATFRTRCKRCEVNGRSLQKAHEVLEARGVPVHAEQKQSRVLCENRRRFCDYSSVLQVNNKDSVK